MSEELFYQIKKLSRNFKENLLRFQRKYEICSVCLLSLKSHSSYSPSHAIYQYRFSNPMKIFFSKSTKYSWLTLTRSNQKSGSFIDVSGSNQSRFVWQTSEVFLHWSNLNLLCLALEMELKLLLWQRTCRTSIDSLRPETGEPAKLIKFGLKWMRNPKHVRSPNVIHSLWCQETMSYFMSNFTFPRIRIV